MKHTTTYLGAVEFRATLLECTEMKGKHTYTCSNRFKLVLTWITFVTKWHYSFILDKASFFFFGWTLAHSLFLDRCSIQWSPHVVFFTLWNPMFSEYFFLVTVASQYIVFYFLMFSEFWLRKYLAFTRFEVVRVVLLKVQVFWDMTLFHSVRRSWCLEGLQSLHLQTLAVKTKSQPEDKVLQSFGMPGTAHSVTIHHIPEGNSYINVVWFWVKVQLISTLSLLEIMTVQLYTLVGNIIYWILAKIMQRVT